METEDWKVWSIYKTDPQEAISTTKATFEIFLGFLQNIITPVSLYNETDPTIFMQYWPVT